MPTENNPFPTVASFEEALKQAMPDSFFLTEDDPHIKALAAAPDLRSKMIAWGVPAYATYRQLGEIWPMAPFAEHIRGLLQPARVAEVVPVPAEWLPKAPADVIEALCDLYGVHSIRKAAA